MSGKYQINNNHALCSLSFFMLFFVGSVTADTFDDAVGHYLQGFDACQEANGLLRANKISAAKSQLEVYEKYFADAQEIDPSIVSSNKLDMLGNIKFCQRVETNVAIEEASPYIDKAIEQCDLAQQALKDQKPAQATAYLDGFRTHKEQAWNITDKLSNIFSIRNQVQRCERLGKKVRIAGQEHKILNLSIETVKAESEAYAQTCSQAAKLLSGKSLDEVTIKKATTAISRAASHRKNALDESVALKAFKENPGHDAQETVTINLEKGNVCFAGAEKLLAAKRRELDGIHKALDNYVKKIDKVTAQCDKARSKTRGATTNQAHKDAASLYGGAKSRDKALRASLRKDKNYLSYSGSPRVKKINRSLSQSSECLADTSKRISKMYAALKRMKAKKAKALAAKKAKEQALLLAQASRKEQARIKAEIARKAKLEESRKVKREQDRKEKEEIARKAKEKKAGAAKEKKLAKLPVGSAAPIIPVPVLPAGNLSAKGDLNAISGVRGAITFNSLSEDVAVMYALDGRGVNSSKKVNAVLNRHGFNQDIYVLVKGSAFTIKNKDNSLHRIKGTDEYRGVSKKLLKLLPRQRKKLKYDWESGTFVTMRSDRGGVDSSYLVQVPSPMFKVFNFEAGKSTYEFSYTDIPSRSNKVVMLIPNHDPVEIPYTGSSSQRVPLSQNGEVVGEVSVEFL